MNRFRGPLVFSIILATGGILAVILSLALREKTRTQENPHDYGLETFTQAPSNLARWKKLGVLDGIPAKTDAFAVDGAGLVCVLASGMVHPFTPEGKALAPFAAPAGAVRLSIQRELFVACTDHVEVLSLSGKHLAAWAAPDTKSYLVGISAGGNAVWAVDFTSKCLWHWDLSGRFLGAVGMKDDGGSNGIILPSPQSDVCALPDGSAWVANTGRLLLERYFADGTRKASWGEAGMGVDQFPGCCNPVHLALLPGTGFATGEKGIVRVKVFSSGGKFLALAMDHGDFPQGSPGPQVASDGAGRLHVLDVLRRQVHIFAPGGK